jgi:DNA-binding beta-propeller fold protein YncE
MPKTTTAIVSLLVVASIFAFAQWFSAALARNGVMSALFLVLILIVTIAGTVWRRGGRSIQGNRRFLRWASGLVVLLGPALLQAGPPPLITSFQGVVTVLPVGSIMLGRPTDVTVDSLGDIYLTDGDHNDVVEVTAAGAASVVAFPGLSALSSPQAVAVDESGNLYVADADNSRVVELSAEGMA